MRAVLEQSLVCWSVSVPARQILLIDFPDGPELHHVLQLCLSSNLIHPRSEHTLLGCQLGDVAVVPVASPLLCGGGGGTHLFGGS